MPSPNNTPLTDAQRELAGRYVPLALRMACSFCKAHPSHANALNGAAQYGLITAARSYQPERGYQFVTIARYHIRGQLLDELKSIASNREFPETDCGLLSYRREQTAVPPTPGRLPEPEVGHDLDQAERFEALIGRLSPVHQNVLRLIYRDGLEQFEVVKRLSLSKSRVSNLHAEALHAIRYEIGLTRVPPSSRKRGRRSRLADATFREIHRRRMAGESSSALAREFGVSPSYVTEIAGSVRKYVRRKAVVSG